MPRHLGIIDRILLLHYFSIIYFRNEKLFGGVFIKITFFLSQV